MGQLTENIKMTENLIKEFPTSTVNFPVRAKLEYDTKDDSWWFAFYPEGARMALGSADLYKVPDDLRQKMNLDSLLQKDNSGQ
jgi:hypothetical protein